MVNNTSQAIHNIERSILSVVFFDSKVQLQEQASIGALAKNYMEYEANDTINNPNYFTGLSRFFKDAIGKSWNKVFALIPSESFLMVPTIFYDEDLKESLYKKAKLSFSGELKSIKPVKTNSHLLYSFNHKLEMFLHNNFPGIEIYADVHWLINHAMLSTEADCILSMYDANQLKLVVKKDGQLQMCNNYNASNTEEIVYFIAYALQQVWPEKHQQKQINLHACKTDIDTDLLWQYYPNAEVNDTSKNARMLQLISECV